MKSRRCLWCSILTTKVLCDACVVEILEGDVQTAPVLASLYDAGYVLLPSPALTP